MTETMPNTPTPSLSSSPNARLYFLLTRTPLHIGCGDSLGHIDKPVMRHVVTGHPLVPGSEVKGCVKGPAEFAWKFGDAATISSQLDSLFGKSGDNGAGMVCPQDAQLLLLPVACWAGGWAWVTCPAVLHRLRRSCATLNLGTTPTLPAVPTLNSSQSAALTEQCQGVLLSKTRSGDWLVLGEAALIGDVVPEASQWAEWLASTAWGSEADDWKAEFRRRLAIVPDEVFDWLAEVATDVRAHNKLGEDGVAEDKHLWRQEYVPEDAVFWGAITVQPVGNNPGKLTEAQALAAAQNCEIQLGGRASVGCGWASLRPISAGANA